MNSDAFVGELILGAGLVDAAGLARGLEVTSQQPITLGRALASLGLADESAVAAAIAAAQRLEFLEGEFPEVGREIAALLPAAFCRRRLTAPLGLAGATLRIAVTNPMDYSILQDAEFRAGRKVLPVVVTQTWLEGLLERLFPETTGLPTHDLPAGEVEEPTDTEHDLVDPASLEANANLSPIVRLVNQILSDAARAGASDIHIEPHETLLQVRQRVDGMLHNAVTIPRHLQDATISRLKIMARMDISERRKPQDGRSRLRFDGRRIDLRVSTIPTQFGEKVVIRLLNANQGVIPIDKLDLSPENLRLLQSFLSTTQGMILVTGPTGSGKTSTLYAALDSIKSSSNNIITLEDPIEMQIAGVNQMQINVRAGVTFANGLRSILRQDPNVILVGEIRDQETADIAFGAAQTGHLLLSTLHTNDAVATITRLFDLGVQPYLLAASLIGIVAQRLVRRPCGGCTVRQEPSAETLERIGSAFRLPADGQWVVGRGCALCGQTGLKGRIAIHEVLSITDELRDLMSTRAADHVIKRAAKRAGMRTLLEDGIDKAAQGLTTLDEVLRVVSRGEGELVADGAATEAAHAVPAVDPVAAPVAAPSIDRAEGADGPRVRVLVVEDSATVVVVAKYFLELEGFEVLVASDGRAGLETALRERPDVIISDVNMPGMGGMEMVRALRSDERTSGVRILMLTAESSVESEAEGLAAGADDYVLKPVEPRRLAARVKALCARSGLSAVRGR